MPTPLRRSKVATDREGLAVPAPIPTTDGRLFADGLVVMTYVEGTPPEAEADWRRVADTLRQR
jgi:Ser/Thr protein kinase RdoA (MazF antagonist)